MTRTPAPPVVLALATAHCPIHTMETVVLPKVKVILLPKVKVILPLRLKATLLRVRDTHPRVTHPRATLSNSRTVRVHPHQ